MRPRTTYLLLILVLLLGAFIVLVERKAETTEHRLLQARRALRVDPDLVSMLRIETTNYMVVCERDHAQWLMREPVMCRADAGRVRQVLTDLERLPKGNLITPADRKREGLTLDDYGLQEPAARVSFREGDLVRTLYVGRNAPLGHEVYVMESNRPEIVATDTNLWDALPPSPEALRSRQLVTSPPHTIRRLEIKRPAGFLKLARDEDGTWTMQQPLVGRAGGYLVSDLLEKFHGARIQAFVADRVTDLAPYGLADPQAVITLWPAGAAEPEVLALGEAVPDDPEQLYAATREAGSVYTVSRRVLLEADLDHNVLRDRRFLARAASDFGYVRLQRGDQVVELEHDADGVWQLTKPRRRPAAAALVWGMISDWANARIEDFVADGVTNAAAYGLAPGEIELVMAGRRPEEPAPEAVPEGAAASDAVHIAARLKDDSSVEAMLSHETSVYELSRRVLSRVSFDPLFYYDRLVLAARPEDVRSITLQRGSREQTVQRGEDGAFHAATPPGATVIEAVANNVLTELGSLMALVYVEEDPQDPGQYGLEPPQASITIGLTGEAGISKAVLFGSEVEPGGVHAMIRGLDLVFVMNRSVRDRLLSDLCIVPDSAGEGPVVSPAQSNDPL